MKRLMVGKGLATVLCILFLNASAFSQVVSYNILPESKITVTGTSSLHDWTIKVNKFNGQISMKKPISQRQALKKGDTFENVEIKMEVKSMESGRGSVMDNRTHDALKAEQNPEITFKSKKAEVVEVKNAAEGTFVMKSTGDLTIAGVTKPVELTIQGQKLKDGKLVFSGSKSLKMTDFDIKPPTAMFGQITTGDEVTIQFEQLTVASK